MITTAGGSPCRLNQLHQTAATLRFFDEKIEMGEVGHARAPNAAVAVGDDHARMTSWTVVGALTSTGKPPAVRYRRLSALLNHSRLNSSLHLFRHY